MVACFEGPGTLSRVRARLSSSVAALWLSSSDKNRPTSLKPILMQAHPLPCMYPVFMPSGPSAMSPRPLRYSSSASLGVVESHSATVLTSKHRSSEDVKAYLYCCFLKK